MDPGGEVNAFMDETRHLVAELKCKLSDATAELSDAKTMLQALEAKLGSGPSQMESLEAERTSRSPEKERAPGNENIPADALLAGNASPSHISMPEFAAPAPSARIESDDGSANDAPSLPLVTEQPERPQITEPVDQVLSRNETVFAMFELTQKYTFELQQGLLKGWNDSFRQFDRQSQMCH